MTAERILLRGSKPASLTVAAIQVPGEAATVAETLESATSLVRSACKQGAQLVLCPELMTAPYTLSSTLWSFAEHQNGTTESWLLEMARNQGVFIGAGFLEASGTDFFNTFTLAQPNGQLAGRVRKHIHGFFEGPLFKAAEGPRWIQTELGKIGVGICFDNYCGGFRGEVMTEEVDLILMPHCWPSQVRPHGLTRVMDELFDQIASEYARCCRVPVVLANKGGQSSFRTSIQGIPFVRPTLRFPGGSRICDRSGRPMARLGSEVGMIVSTVQLAAAKSLESRFPRLGYWTVKPGRLSHLLALSHQLLTTMGRIRYYLSAHRSREASRVCRESVPVEAVRESQK